MAIYDFPNAEKGNLNTAACPQEAIYPEADKSEVEPAKTSSRGQIFSAIAARLFFLLLLAADLIWICYSVVVFLLSVTVSSISGGKLPFFKNLSEKTWVSLRRSLVCGVSLMVTLFSPAFGVMIACTYFLMYDKAGIEEVVPSSLQSQFKEFLPQNKPE